MPPSTRPHHASALPKGDIGAPSRWRHAVIIAIGMSTGLWWSLAWEVYDLRAPGLRVALTALGTALSFVLLWAGLALTGAPRPIRGWAAGLALLPWTAVLLGQLPYIGYGLIPLEVVASALVLRRYALVSWKWAVLLAASVRALVFVCLAFLSAAIRGGDVYVQMTWSPGDRCSGLEPATATRSPIARRERSRNSRGCSRARPRRSG